MKKITDIKSLEFFLANINTEENLKLEDLSLSLVNESLSKKLIQQLTLLHQISPCIQELRLNIERTNLENSFLVSLQSTLDKLDALKGVYVSFKNGNFSLKRIKVFFQYVHSRFYPDEQIQYKYQEGQIFLIGGQCSIGFQYSADNSLWIKDPKIKHLEVFIEEGQTDFLKIIKSANQNEADNLKVLLYHEESLMIICSNCSPSYQLELKLNFRDSYDLFQLYINDHFLVEINITTEGQRVTFSESDIKSQMNRRHNFGFRNKQDLVFYSFKSQKFSEKQKKYIEESLKKYQVNFQNQVILNNQFKIDFFKQFLFPYIIENSKNIPYEIGFHMKQEYANHFNVMFRIKNRTEYRKERLKLYLEFDQVSEVIHMMRHYFDFCQEEESEIMTLKLYDNNHFSRYFNYQEFINELSTVDTKNYIKKLSIKFQSQEPISYPIISNLKHLKIISISGCQQKAAEQFLLMNGDYLNYSKGKSMLSLIISASFMGLYNLGDRPFTLLSTQRDFTFDRINSIVIYGCNKINTNQKAAFYYFKRLANLSSFTSYKYIKHLKKLEENDNNNYDQSYNDYFSQEIKWYKTFLEKNGKIHYAYQLVDNHDDPICSETRKELCTCNNNQFEKLLKESDIFYTSKMYYDSLAV